MASPRGPGSRDHSAFGDVVALSGIDPDVAYGQILGLVESTGAGTPKGAVSPCVPDVAVAGTAIYRLDGTGNGRWVATGDGPME